MVSFKVLCLKLTSVICSVLFFFCKVAKSVRENGYQPERCQLSQKSLRWTLPCFCSLMRQLHQKSYSCGEGLEVKKCLLVGLHASIVCTSMNVDMHLRLLNLKSVCGKGGVQTIFVLLGSERNLTFFWEGVLLLICEDNLHISSLCLSSTASKVQPWVPAGWGTCGLCQTQMCRLLALYSPQSQLLEPDCSRIGELWPFSISLNCSHQLCQGAEGLTSCLKEAFPLERRY